MIASNPNGPTFKFDDFSLEWQMTRCEKFAFHSLVEFVKPEVAIEIGTYKGGSLQVLAQHADSVYSLDIDPNCRKVLGPRFDNVEFLTGRSRSVLPPLLRKIASSGCPLEFVLIDGEHTAEAVRNDINDVLKYQPVKPLYIVFHDSFNPACRKGILAADWAACPFVHFVEVDFVPGVYHHEGFDHAEPRSMYGGLAVALMLPSPRDHQLVVHQSQKGLFDVVLKRSCHSTSATGMVANFSRKILRKLRA
ncbi:class I SAM-dependent methyltransferase [Elongatibacter sediminis]|uniref:Class I SAM-dependent methyltransferase n=1 Tax=Elongatibacter sediminis TaxID=3119006 RepID=A0AAW9RH79_9GAMM